MIVIEPRWINLVLPITTSTMSSFFHRYSLILSIATLTACTSPESESETRQTGINVLEASALKEAKTGNVSFTAHVKPILEAKCAMCHNQSAQPGRLSMASLEEAKKTGTLGIFIIPENPDQSRFISQINSAHASLKAMPPVGETLTSDEITLLRRWISQGAEWPTGKAGTLKTER
jgi:uncharacterized membrane protein